MKSFKQFIIESAPTPGNVDGSYTIGEVKFDNKNGLGATSNNANVLYRGAVAWIKPSVFRKLAALGDREDTAKEIIELIKNGEAIAAPFLLLDIKGNTSNPDSVKIYGHEGRARSDAFKILNGDVCMPVQLHPLSIRARDLSEDFFKWVEAHGIISEKSNTSIKLDAEKYFWNGKTISLDS